MVDFAAPIDKNIGMLFFRGVPSSNDFVHIFITDTVVDLNHMQIRGGTIVAPLFLHNELDGSWQPNFDPATLTILTEHMTHTPSPIEIFDYIYAILLPLPLQRLLKV